MILSFESIGKKEEEEREREREEERDGEKRDRETSIYNLLYAFTDYF